jgi:hypothetical protein
VEDGSSSCLCNVAVLYQTTRRHVPEVCILYEQGAFIEKLTWDFYVQLKFSSDWLPDVSGFGRLVCLFVCLFLIQTSFFVCLACCFTKT